MLLHSPRDGHEPLGKQRWRDSPGQLRHLREAASTRSPARRHDVGRHATGQRDDGGGMDTNDVQPCSLARLVPPRDLIDRDGPSAELIGELTGTWHIHRVPQLRKGWVFENATELAHLGHRAWSKSLSLGIVASHPGKTGPICARGMSDDRMRTRVQPSVTSSGPGVDVGHRHVRARIVDIQRSDIHAPQSTTQEAA